MKLRPLALCLLIGGPLFASCSALPPRDFGTASHNLLKSSTVHVGTFHRSVEIEKVDFDDSGFVRMRVKDLRRRRTGVQVGFGVNYARGFVEAFQEDFLGTDENYGVATGFTGRVPVHTFVGDLALVVPYSIGARFVHGDEISLAGSTADFSYVEVAIEAGIGINFHGFEPSVGLTSKSLTGNLDFDGERDDDDFDDFDADLISAFAELAYRHPSAGLAASLRVLGGEEKGAYVSLAWGL